MRLGPHDSNTSRDWDCLNGDKSINIAGPKLSRDPSPFTILEAGPFAQGRWRGVIRADASIEGIRRNVRITWTSIPGAIYTVELGLVQSGSLLWHSAHPGWVIAEEEKTSFMLSPAGAAAREPRFVRVLAWQSGH